MAKTDQTGKVILEGVLIPVAWEGSGKVQIVGLMTFDEEEYRIDSTATMDHNLSQLLRKHVRISGLIRGHRVIKVASVEVLGNEGSGEQ